MNEGNRMVVTRDGSGRVGIQEEPIPELKPGTILVEVKSCLVSPGTELASLPRLRRKPRPEIPAKPFGYGNAGVILKVGEGCEEYSVGQRVACMGGGVALHASHVVVPKNLTTPIPEEVSFDEAAFAHLAATSLWSIRRSEIQFGENVTIFGLGIVGQIAAQMARNSGAHVMALDRLPLRLKIAKDCGADVALNFEEADVEVAAKDFTRGHGMDVAIMAFGGDATKAMDTACSIMKKSPDGHQYGRITIVGGARFTAKFPNPYGNIDVRASSRPGPGYHDKAWEIGQEYPPVFVQWTTRRNMEECLLFAAKKRLDFKALITHRVPLSEAPEGCEELIQNPDTAMGLILHP